MPLIDTGHIYLARANDDLVSYCRCAESLITFPPQMDCPWCGCGWLFTCIECRKAFTFARGFIALESWEQTAGRDLRNYSRKEPTAEDVSTWVGAMKELLADVRVGEEYVYLDGLIIPKEAKSVEFEGWHSRHDLPYVPQLAALVDPSVVASVLASQSYWHRTGLQGARGS